MCELVPDADVHVKLTTVLYGTAIVEVGVPVTDVSWKYSTLTFEYGAYKYAVVASYLLSMNPKRLPRLVNGTVLCVLTIVIGEPIGKYSLPTIAVNVPAVGSETGSTTRTVSPVNGLYS
jgi:hypothetical protein